MKVAILDAGAQYSKLIDGRIRDLGVESLILPIDTSLATIRSLDCGAIVISGGPGSVTEKDSPKCLDEIFQGSLPVLGICYGMQLINKFFGGSVEARGCREDGVFEINLDPTCRLFFGLEANQNVMLTHGDSLGTISPFLTVIANSDCAVAGVSFESKQIYGVQFHPEVYESVCGSVIFQNFLFNISKLTAYLNITDSLSTIKSKIKEKIGSHHVIVFTSGGVDSTVCACLLKDLIGQDRVHGLFVDHGFMREGEVEEITSRIRKLGIRLNVVEAKTRFLNSSTCINGVQTGPLYLTTEPEQKRKIIGDTFRHVFDDYLNAEGLNFKDYLLCQGTLRPDLIESASKDVSFAADTIKTHHNDTEAIRKLRKEGRIIEPLSDLHKHEVIKIAQLLNIPNCTTLRHPFPGPGLSIRVICAEKPYLCSSQDFPMLDTILNFNKYYKVESDQVNLQYSTIIESMSDNTLKMLSKYTINNINFFILPVRSVGVQGDGRSYRNPVVLQTTDLCNIDWNAFVFLSKLIPKLCHGINRVTLMLDERLPDFSRVEKVTETYLNLLTLDKLRRCDFIVTEIMAKYNLFGNISQCPVVMLPIDFENYEKPCFHSIVIRPFITRDFMTGSAAIPPEIPFKALLEMTQQIKLVPGISRVILDLACKPPGTTEWE